MSTSVSALAKRYGSTENDSLSYNGISSQEKNKQRYYGGNLYHPAPSATKLEININQHNSSPTPSSSYSASPVMAHHHSRPAEPFTSPPPRPPRQSLSEYASADCMTTGARLQKATAPPLSPTLTKASTITKGPAATERNGMFSTNAAISSSNSSERNYWKGAKFAKIFGNNENSIMLRVCLAQLLFSLLVLSGGIWCYFVNPLYCPYYSGIFAASLFIVNALLGIVTAKVATVNFYVAHLVLSLVSMIVCILGALISAINWDSLGTYRHPKITRDGAFCILGEHDAPRLSHVFSHMDKYNFRRCLFQAKVGLAVNTVQFVAEIFLFLLFLFTAILCMKRICTRCRWRH